MRPRKTNRGNVPVCVSPGKVKITRPFGLDSWSSSKRLWSSFLSSREGPTLTACFRLRNPYGVREFSEEWDPHQSFTFDGSGTSSVLNLTIIYLHLNNSVYFSHNSCKNRIN